MANNFFKHNDKVYSENLNDSVLIGNSFSLIVDIGLPGDTGGVFPNSDSVVKAKVADVSVTPNSNLSIGETVSNDSGSNQEYRLTVYPNFNRFGGFTSVSVTGDADLFIANKGASSPIVDNLDYSDLGNVPELKVLKEYDIVLTLGDGDVVSGLSFGFQSSAASADASISQANVSGLVDDLSSLSNSITNITPLTGTKTGITVNSKSYISVWVPHNFGRANYVFTQLNLGNRAGTELGNLSINVYDMQQNGFYAYIYNSMGSNITLSFHYLVVPI